MGILFEDDKVKTQENGILLGLDENVIRKVRRFAEYFADLSMKNFEFLSWKPSIMALCCVLCARMSI